MCMFIFMWMCICILIYRFIPIYLYVHIYEGVKGHFEVEVYSSESIKLTPLPESYSRMIAGEWIEANAG
jgi:hypothetical protein